VEDVLGESLDERAAMTYVAFFRNGIVDPHSPLKRFVQELSASTQRRRRGTPSQIRQQNSQTFYKENFEAVKKWMEAVLGCSLPGADLPSFMGELKNGVFLCKLVMLIDPTLEQQYQSNRPARPGSRLGSTTILGLQNLNFFLQSVQSMGVQKTDLFTPPDLMEMKNPNLVLMCLRALANTTSGKGKVPPLVGAPGLDKLHPFETLDVSLRSSRAFTMPALPPRQAPPQKLTFEELVSRNKSLERQNSDLQDHIGICKQEIETLRRRCHFYRAELKGIKVERSQTENEEISADETDPKNTQEFNTDRIASEVVIAMLQQLDSLESWVASLKN